MITTMITDTTTITTMITDTTTSMTTSMTTGMDTKLPPLLRGRVLLNDGGIIVVHNQRQQQVECRMTMATDGMASLQQKLIKNLQTLNQCFVINQDSLAPRKS